MKIHIGDDVYQHDLSLGILEPTKKRNEIWRGARSRAREKKLPFNITPADFDFPEKCPLLKIKLDYESYTTCAESPSLDRIDNDKGYTLDNIWIISHRANTIKNNATVGELLAIAFNLRRKLMEV